MIVRAPLDDCDGYEFYSLNDRSAYHGGCIGHEVEVEPDTKPRRPIGFRMPERDPVIDDPSWLLI